MSQKRKMSNQGIDLSRVSLRQRRTKIVATMGPASASAKMIADLLAAGVNVFRLNFSHGDHQGHAEVYKHIRAASEDAGSHAAVLADMCGPKIRVGVLEGGAIELAEGKDVVVTTKKVEGKAGLIPSQYELLARDVEPGDRILMDDGRLELAVLETDGTDIRASVVRGGTLRSKKGINLPGVNISTPTVTDKDREDAAFAAKLGVDFIALSFVRSASDIQSLKKLIQSEGCSTPVIAKIEKPEALKEVRAIVEAADGIMIARGDLGVEMPAEEVPLLQEELIRISIEANKPVIVATQMLESMINSATPTRAEVADVASAVSAGADAVMLSGETAVGKYPIAAVSTMNRILRRSEGYAWKLGRWGQARTPPNAERGHISDIEALARATSMLSASLQARAIAVPTATGFTARMVAAERPAAPIVAMTDDPLIARRLALLWGILAEVITTEALHDPVGASLEVVHRLEFAPDGEPVLMVWDAGRGGKKIGISITLLH